MSTTLKEYIENLWGRPITNLMVTKNTISWQFAATCGICSRELQSTDDLTRCMTCGRDYCDSPDCATNTVGVCRPCSRSKVGIV
jgi:hypothetical protein